MRSALLVGAFLVALTSCIKNGGNMATLPLLYATVVADDNARVLVQLDANGGYYFADELLPTNLIDLSVGDRILLHTTTINYDEQPAGANGSQAAPFFMTAVDFSVMPTSYIMDAVLDPETKNDTLSIMYPPAVTKSDAGNFITVQVVAPKNSLPEMRMVFVKKRAAASSSEKDTLEYELKTKYERVGDATQGEVGFHSFRIMSEPASLQPLLIKYSAKRFFATEYMAATDSTFVIRYPEYKEM